MEIKPTTGNGLKDLRDALTLLIDEGIEVSSPTHCEHDELYLCVDPKQVKADTIAQLEAWGFITDFDEGYFTSFRFGSA